MIFEPLAGSELPTPTMKTVAPGSDACQESVTDSPGQTEVFENVRSRVGSAHGGAGFGRTARRLPGDAVCDEEI